MKADGKLALFIRWLLNRILAKIMQPLYCHLAMFKAEKILEHDIPVLLIEYGETTKCPSIKERLRKEAPFTLMKKKEKVNPGYMLFGKTAIPVSPRGFESIPLFTCQTMPDQEGTLLLEFQSHLRPDGMWILMVMSGKECSLFMIETETGNIVEEQTIERKRIKFIDPKEPGAPVKGI